MKPLSPVLFAFFIICLVSCDQIENLTSAGRDPDPLINEQVVESVNYNLTTPVYGVRVAIDNAVSAGTSSILNLIDNQSTSFLNCQFAEGAEIGNMDFELAGGRIVSPLSELRVYVVPREFECDAVGLSVCAGIQFDGLDVIVISEGGFFDCGDFPFLKHELGHRYGMEPDHSNQFLYDACIEPPDCSLEDIINIGIGG